MIQPPTSSNSSGAVRPPSRPDRRSAVGAPNFNSVRRPSSARSSVPLYTTTASTRRRTALAPHRPVAGQFLQQHRRVLAHPLRHAPIHRGLELHQEQQPRPRAAGKPPAPEAHTPHHVAHAGEQPGVDGLPRHSLEGREVELVRQLGGSQAQKVRYHLGQGVVGVGATHASPLPRRRGPWPHDRPGVAENGWPFSPRRSDIRASGSDRPALTTDWVRFHQVKPDMLLRIAGIIGRHGAGFAFPTSPVHLSGGMPCAEPTPGGHGFSARHAPRSSDSSG